MITQHLVLIVRGERVELAFKTKGNGPSILLFHGLMHSSEIWGPISALLEPEFELIMIDLPGFGHSPPLSTGDVTLSNYADIVSAAIYALSAKRRITAIVADSLSTVLLTIALKDNALPSQPHLLLSGCPFDGLPLMLKLLPASFLIKLGLILMRKMPRILSKWLIIVFSRYVVHHWSTGADEIFYGVMHADPETTKRLVDSLKTPISKSALSSLSRYECKLLRGKFDRIVSHLSMSQHAQTVNAIFVELADSGHTPMIEEPEKYSQCIRDLMRPRVGHENIW